MHTSEVQPLHATITLPLIVWYQRRLLALQWQQERRGRTFAEARRVAFIKLKAELRILPEAERTTILKALELLE